MRTVAVITPPAAIVTTAEAKKQLGVTGAGDDTYIDSLVAVATQTIDGPNGWLGRAIGSQTLELRMDRFPCADEISLPLPPLVSRTSVKYDDADGAEQTLSAEDYRLTGAGTDAGLIRLKSGKSWPNIIEQAEAVRVRYVAGYGLAEAVPGPIKQAVLLMVQALYGLKDRNLFISSESVDGVASTSYVVSENAGNVMRTAAEGLLAPYCIW